MIAFSTAVRRDEAVQAKKKGRSGHERPKSREETPKEGYDNAG